MMCFDVNDYASRKEAHFRQLLFWSDLPGRHGCSTQGLIATGIIPSYTKGIKKEPFSRLFPHAAKKNHSNFILIAVYCFYWCSSRLAITKKNAILNLLQVLSPQEGSRLFEQVFLRTHRASPLWYIHHPKVRLLQEHQ